MNHMRVYERSVMQREDILSILMIHKHERLSPFLDGADCLYVLIVTSPATGWETKQLVCEGEFIVEQEISLWQLEAWAIYGVDERFAFWLQQAEIVWDKDDYMKLMKERLLRLSVQAQKRRVCEEYSRFLRYFLEAKELLQQGFTLDAYHSVLLALHSWARLVVCETGEQPEISIWMQVKHLDPSVYKLYEELVVSNEPLEKRIELLLLPIEFCITSKMKDCAQYLLDVLQSRNRPLTLNDLQKQPELANSQIDLQLLLEKMVQRSLVHEILLPAAGENLNEKGYLWSS